MTYGKVPEYKIISKEEEEMDTFVEFVRNAFQFIQETPLIKELRQEAEKERMEYHKRFDILEENLEWLSIKMDKTSQYLMDKMSGMFQSIEDLKKSITPSTTTVVLREITRPQAKKEIWKLIKESKGKIFPSDIARKLSIDYDLTLEITQELIAENKIEIAEE